MGGAGGATAIVNINKLMQSAPEVEVRDLAKNEMPRLIGLGGQYYKKEFYLMRTEWKVGRTEENDMQVDHQSMSRQHCKFQLEADGWKIYDNKSANGVKVNGETYGVAPVKPGDTVEFGHVKFRFCAPGEKFIPPPEKVEGAPTPAAGSKPAPTTAELIAGAKAPHGKAAAPAAKSKMPLIIGGAVAAVVVVVVLVLVVGKGGGKEVDENGNPTGEAALKAAKSAEAKKDYRKASELAEAAGDKATASYKSKMAAEAAGQDALEKLDAAVEKGDGDAAMAAFEKCSSENTYYCGKAKQKEEAVKTAFAKKHLDAARAAKGSNPTACTEEVGKVLAKDPSNSEAQQVQGECSPAKKEAPAPPKAEAQGPSQKDRDAAATRLLASAVAKVGGGDNAGGINDFKACIAAKPSKEILGRCWKNLGIAHSRAGDNPSAVKALKTYLNYCDADCEQIKAAIARFGG